MITWDRLLLGYYYPRGGFLSAQTLSNGNYLPEYFLRVAVVLGSRGWGLNRGCGGMFESTMQSDAQLFAMEARSPVCFRLVFVWLIVASLALAVCSVFYSAPPRTSGKRSHAAVEHPTLLALKIKPFVHQIPAAPCSSNQHYNTPSIIPRIIHHFYSSGMSQFLHGAVLPGSHFRKEWMRSCQVGPGDPPPTAASQ